MAPASSFFGASTGTKESNQQFENASYIASSSTADQDHTDGKDYWFGKKYVACALAHSLLSSTNDDEDFPILDSKLEATVQNYPYRQGLKYLNKNGISTRQVDPRSDGLDAQVAFLTIAGEIVRRGPRKEKKTLLIALRFPEKIRSFEIPPTQHSPGNRDSQTPGIGRSSSDSGSEPKPSDYYRALKEHADRNEVKLKESSRQTGETPARTTVNLQYESHGSVVTANTKKNARHLAAVELCNKLGLEPL